MRELKKIGPILIPQSKNNSHQEARTNFDIQCRKRAPVKNKTPTIEKPENSEWRWTLVAFLQLASLFLFSRPQLTTKRWCLHGQKWNNACWLDRHKWKLPRIVVVFCVQKRGEYPKKNIPLAFLPTLASIFTGHKRPWSPQQTSQWDGKMLLPFRWKGDQWRICQLSENRRRNLLWTLGLAATALRRVCQEEEEEGGKSRVFVVHEGEEEFLRWIDAFMLRSESGDF